MANIFGISGVDTAQTPDHVVSLHCAYRTDRYAATDFRLAQNAGSVVGNFDDESQNVFRTQFLDAATSPDNLVPQWLAYHRSFLVNISTVINRGLLALGVGAFLTNIAEIPNRAAFYFRSKKGT